MRISFLSVIVAILSTFAVSHPVAAQQATRQPAVAEFIRVADNKWTFEGVETGQRFVPFGANLVFHDPSGRGQGLDLLVRPDWDPVTVRRLFVAAQQLQLNVLKVFLPSSGVLRDPQSSEVVHLADMVPPLPERLDFVFQTARETGVYVSLTLAEWGMHSLHWWQEGGTFVGRGADNSATVDSHAVLRGFWRTVAERYRDEPMLFSYNLAVEFYLLGRNWGAHQAGRPGGELVMADRWGLPAWRSYLQRTCGDVADINARWGTNYSSLDEIPQPEFIWVGERADYSMPQAMLADYNEFKEELTDDFLRNQVAAIRSVDQRHMITCGYHPHHPTIGWMGSAAYLAGTAPRDLDMLDYTTVHVYTNQLDYQPGVEVRRLRGAVMAARFAWGGKPVIAEEMGHITVDRGETIRETLHLAESLRPHVSGFMLWFLSDLAAEQPFGPLSVDLTENELGRAWRGLAVPGGFLDTMPTERAPAVRTIRLDRLEGLAPKRPTLVQQLVAAGPDDALAVDVERERLTATGESTQ